MKPKLTGAQKEEIQMYIKNQIDISPLIANYSIAGENFSNAIIKTFNRPDEDISGLILANAIIGEDGKITNLNRVIAHHCNFRRSTWKGNIWARRANLQYSAFTDAFVPYLDYRYADCRHCDFCNAVWQIGTEKGLGAQFSEDFFQDLAKYWNVEITLKKAPNGSHIQKPI